MKITDLVGRLAVKYPGLCTKHAASADAYYLYVPHQFRVEVSAYEMISVRSDDALVDSIEAKIEDAMRCVNA